jgi:septum site-determining protein MinC
MEEVTNPEIPIEIENPDSIEEEIPPSVLERYKQIHLKSDREKLLLILPKAEPNETVNDRVAIVAGLKYYLKNTGQSWPAGTLVHLLAGDRLLDTRQLQEIHNTLEDAGLDLQTIQTRRRQTAVAAATAGYNVEQQRIGPDLSGEEKPPSSLFAEPLYLKTTLRSGIEIRHPGTVVVVGDVNPGGSIVADGDIIICGSLRGIAHAGARGDRASVIFALRMEPTQLRLADLVARAPALDRVEPEIACASEGIIRIIGAYNFSKTYRYSDRAGWTEKER